MLDLQSNNINDLEVQDLASAIQNNTVNLIPYSFISYVTRLINIDIHDIRSW
jgi:hypothetical protein